MLTCVDIIGTGPKEAASLVDNGSWSVQDVYDAIFSRSWPRYESQLAFLVGFKESLEALGYDIKITEALDKRPLIAIKKRPKVEKLAASLAGTPIENICEKAVLQATKNNSIVEFEFNGVELRTGPGIVASGLVCEFYRSVKPRLGEVVRYDRYDSAIQVITPDGVSVSFKADAEELKKAMAAKTGIPEQPALKKYDPLEDFDEKSYRAMRNSGVSDEDIVKELSNLAQKRIEANARKIMNGQGAAGDLPAMVSDSLRNALEKQRLAKQQVALEAERQRIFQDPQVTIANGVVDYQWVGLAGRQPGKTDVWNAQQKAQPKEKPAKPKPKPVGAGTGRKITIDLE